MKPAVTELNRSTPHSRWGAIEVGPRRSGHGGLAWAGAGELWQPQDGALNTEVQVTEIRSTRLKGPFGNFAKLNEPEDAGLTGTTRSLNRRLLGLNILSMAKPVVRETAMIKHPGVGKGHPQVA